MVQGGDPTGVCKRAAEAAAAAPRLRRRGAPAAGTGRGGASIWGGKFPDEIRDTLKARASVVVAAAAASAADAARVCAATALGAGHRVDGQLGAQHEREPVLHHLRQARAPERRVDAARRAGARAFGRVRGRRARAAAEAEAHAGKYTVFGRVISGLEVLDQMEKVWLSLAAHDDCTSYAAAADAPRPRRRRATPTTCRCPTFA